jgi:deoxyadenosine/deoxycytidine kinase
MKRFVFLEGGPAVGKSSLCQELSKRGFRVHFELFVELCEKHPAFKPGALVMSFKWANEMVARMEEFSLARSSGGGSSLFFFDRSLLTPYVFARAHRDHLAFYVDLMHEVRSVFPCSVVLLKADAETVKKRLLRRYEESTPAEKIIRQNLNEMNDEWVSLINQRYGQLFDQPGVFDMALDTSSATVEENVDQLLSSLEKHT